MVGREQRVGLRASSTCRSRRKRQYLAQPLYSCVTMKYQRERSSKAPMMKTMVVRGHNGGHSDVHMDAASMDNGHGDGRQEYMSLSALSDNRLLSSVVIGYSGYTGSPCSCKASKKESPLRSCYVPVTHSRELQPGTTYSMLMNYKKCLNHADNRNKWLKNEKGRITLRTFNKYETQNGTDGSHRDIHEHPR
jgi:hypothetical protein